MLMILNLLACAFILMLLPKPIRAPILWVCGFLAARFWRAAKAVFTRNSSEIVATNTTAECAETTTVDNAFEPILEPACIRKARKQGKEFAVV